MYQDWPKMPSDQPACFQVSSYLWLRQWSSSERKW